MDLDERKEDVHDAFRGLPREAPADERQGLDDDVRVRRERLPAERLELRRGRRVVRVVLVEEREQRRGIDEGGQSASASAR
jgi:hypothetical protein